MELSQGLCVEARFGDALGDAGSGFSFRRRSGEGRSKSAWRGAVIPRSRTGRRAPSVPEAIRDILPAAMNRIVEAHRRRRAET